MNQLRSAIDAFQGLAAQDAADISAHRSLGTALNRRASHLIETGDAEAAETDLQRSEEVLATLYQNDPNNLMILRDLADCYRVKGDLAAHLSKSQDAKLAYQKSLDLWNSWTKIGKSSVYAQRQRAIAISLVSKACQHAQKTSSLGLVS